MSSVEDVNSWRELNEKLKTATEAECLSMINDELIGAGRLRWLERIKGRYNVLRDKRERIELQKKWSSLHGHQAS